MQQQNFQRARAKVLFTFALVLLTTVVIDGAEIDRPVARLKTRWASEVKPLAPLPEYPRPQMEREQWLSLNGPWNYKIAPKDATIHSKELAKWDGTITVPFAIESELSGVRLFVKPTETLWYQRSFEAPTLKDNHRLLIHFQAVDWDTTVWINGVEIGNHKGCYDPFSFDITDALVQGKPNLLTVRVWDPTDTESQPRGKQVQNPEGIWYTSVTGIWQTVWLEQVPQVSLAKLKIVPSAAQGHIQISAKVRGDNASGYKLRVKTEAVRLLDEVQSVAPVEASGDLQDTLTLKIDTPKLWSPATPHLYNLLVELISPSGSIVDRVKSYAGLRDSSIGQAPDGFQRMLINGNPLFQYGPLDQGWWPDGLYTPPTESAMVYDVDVTKDLGFNMIRKHIKVEPERWYAYCDRVGMLVWQDFPSGMRRDGNQFVQADWKEDGKWEAEERAQFLKELRAMIDHLENHPSIVCWVPFNEGWGQHDTNETLQLVKNWDPSRIVDGPSGWTDRGEGDLKDMHHYPAPSMFPTMDNRVSVLGEFGGLGLPIPGHTWLDENNWGYRTYKSESELRPAYDRLVMQLRMLIPKGLSAAVYTQTTDVEVEVNGLMTYDREILKFDRDRLRKIHASLYDKIPEAIVLLPSSQNEPQEWNYTLTKPAELWPKGEARDANWKRGKGGFGKEGTPGIVINTDWTSEEIWIERDFTLSEIPKSGDICLLAIYDEDATVWINGEEVAKLPGYSTEYQYIPLDANQLKALKVGANRISIYCQNRLGGQSIDVGIVHVP